MRANLILGICGIAFAILGMILPGLAMSRTAPNPNNVRIAAYRPAPDLAAVARIKAGEINCKGCNLTGADLSKTCVKYGDLSGARFDNVTAHYMCMSFANFREVSFRNADLTGANLGHSDLNGADLSGATLDIVNLKGADLSSARGLTQAQLDTACADNETKLPAGLVAKSCS